MVSVEPPALCPTPAQYTHPKLEFLMKNAGQVVTRTMLLEHVWDCHFDPQTDIAP